MSELKPCPFCGGVAETVYAYYDYNCWGAACKNCGAYISVMCSRDTDQDAIKAWNRRSTIEDAPTVDAVEVRNGHWVSVTNGRGGNECSECHSYAPSYLSGSEHLSNYCPSCGAKMNKAVEG